VVGGRHDHVAGDVATLSVVALEESTSPGQCGRSDTASTNVTVVVLRGLDVVDLSVVCEHTRTSTELDVRSRMCQQAADRGSPFVSHSR
jgi:hypothetical protein